jgi:hypothetical protein
MPDSSSTFTPRRDLPERPTQSRDHEIPSAGRILRLAQHLIDVSFESAFVIDLKSGARIYMEKPQRRII